MFKKSKKAVVTNSKIEQLNSKVEKLDSKELKKVVGGAVNYNASKSNTGNFTTTDTSTPSSTGGN